MSVDDALDLVVASERPPNGVTEAGMERAAMRRLDVAPGEYVAVEGRTRTVASVAHATVAPDGVALGRAVRTNAAVDPGDRVTVSKAAVEPAAQVTVAPTGDVAVREGPISLAAELAGRPVAAGDAVDVSLLEGSLSLPLSVVDTVPGGPVLVTEQTTVVTRTDPETGRGPAPASFEDVGGLGQVRAALQDAVVRPLADPERYERLGRDPTGGVLLAGPAGGGKTLLARALASETDAATVWLDAATVATMSSAAVAEECRRIAREAGAKAPALVVLDDIDSIAPGDERAGDRDRRVVAHVRSLIDDLAAEPGVALVATARDAEDVAHSLRRGGRLERELVVPVPDREGRREILDVQVRDVPLAPDVDREAVADRTHGFVGADLGALVAEAVVVAGARNAGAVSMADFEAALDVVDPSAMRRVRVDVPDVSYDDVGGLAAAKRALTRSVEWPMRYPELFEHLAASPPRGLLLYGPPGTGKTMLAKAVANATDANFISVKGPEVLDKWVGESERAIRDLFETARQNAPSVVFFDEVDAISSRRGTETGTRAVERVVSQLLTELDGLEPLADVVVVAATNRPDVIDPALLRPGRFEQLVEVGLPDHEGRREIFAVHTRSVPTADVDLDALAEATPGYTGSDVAAVVREASMLAIVEYVDGERTDPPRVTAEHFARALASVDPTGARTAR